MGLDLSIGSFDSILRNAEPLNHFTLRQGLEQKSEYLGRMCDCVFSSLHLSMHRPSTRTSNRKAKTPGRRYRIGARRWPPHPRSDTGRR